jgi:CzcA family heavy metal efflux pump
VFKIVSWSVQHRAATAFLALLALIAGGWIARQVPLDVFPEFVPVQVEIQTEAPGFSPEQVEQLVTRPIEAAINGAPDLAAMRSESIPGLSVISLNFSDSADPHIARQGIAERVNALGSALPAGAGRPELSPLVSSTMDLLKVGLVSDKLDAYALRDRADWVLKPQLLAVPGVARVTVFGGAVREIHIQPDMQKLAAYQFSLTELADAARGALALRGAGFVDLKSQRVLIETPTPAPDPAMVANAVIAVRQGIPIRLADVATVTEAPSLKVGDAVIQGRPGVLLSMSSQFGANTLEVTHAVEDALASLTPALNADGITVYPRMHRPANFIERALANIERSLAIAAVMIFIVLFAFLRNWRSALISFLAIPLSLVAGAVALGYMGHTLNTMTLGGFAVALGVLVDDAIIDIENVLRRMRENASTAAPRPRLEVIRDAILEIRGPVIYATVAVLLVFVPVLMTTGVQGHFLAPLAIAFMLSVLASLVMALTVTPALCALLLTARAAHREAFWIRGLKWAQARIIHGVDRAFIFVMALLTLAFIGTLAWLPYLGGQFMPDFREGSFVVQVNSAVPGTSLDEMTKLGERISKDILALPFVATAEQQLGRAQGSEDTWDTARSEFHVELKPDTTVDQNDAQNQLRDILARYPGLNVEVVTFLGDRMSESLTGETSQMVVNVFGDDLDTLDRVAASVGQAIGAVQGVVDLRVQHASNTPTLGITLDPAALAAYGLKAQDALDVLQSAYAGAVVGQTYAGVRKIDVVMILPDNLRHRIEEIGSLNITSPLGPVPFRNVAHIAPAQGRANILHEGGQRRVTVAFNVEDRPLQDVVNEAKAAVAKAVPQQPGVYLVFAGQAEAEQTARIELTLYTGGTLLLIVMILFLCFKRPAHPWLVMVNLPFSLIGSILAIGISGIGLSLGALVGLVTVFGVGARNSILLLAHYEHLIDNEGAVWDDRTVVRGASERLVPILMTATVTALGLAPLAFGMNQPGQEIEGPMAITVLGGLLTSTLLNLLVLPALAKRFSYRKKREKRGHAFAARYASDGSAAE